MIIASLPGLHLNFAKFRLVKLGLACLLNINLETISFLFSADSELETCNLPPETGPCKAAIPRYFFNPHTHECERFSYGGCQGNANNFKTLEDCEKSCARKIAINFDRCMYW